MIGDADQMFSGQVLTNIVPGSEMEHFLLTRFNVRVQGISGSKIHDMTWLRGRLELFRHFCLASVARQSRVPTAWLIFFDQGTPPEALFEFEEMTSRYPFIRMVLCSEFTAVLAADEVRRRASPSCKWVITTRLDNDDAINGRLLESVFDAALIGTREFINAARGIVVYRDRFYSKLDTSNAFISFSEALENCKTVLFDEHLRLGRHAPIKQLALKYAWMQIIHGGNVANRVRGVRIPRDIVDKQSFPDALLATVRKESVCEMIGDNSVGLLVRYSASFIRRVNRHAREFREMFA